MGLITDNLLLHLPPKRKKTPSGWISFNAPCCSDKRSRGGFIVNAGDGVSYHCFNCGFKASWQPGRTISKKMRKFMQYLMMSDDLISKLSLEALRIHGAEQTELKSIIPTFDERAMPMDAEPLVNFLENPPPTLVPVLEYMVSRNLYPETYDFYWTPKTGFNNRLIVPFYKDGIIVGWTARAVNDAKPRYISEQQPGYVFNLDEQQDDRKFVIVMEGPMDAISIDGCAILGAEIKESQNYLLKYLYKDIVFVPDRDHEGPRTVEQALELDWAVSMPDWPEGIKDVNDAVIKLGKLATMWLITNSIETSKLKVRLRAKKWFKDDRAN